MDEKVLIIRNEEVLKKFYEFKGNLIVKYKNGYNNIDVLNYLLNNSTLE